MSQMRAPGGFRAMRSTRTLETFQDPVFQSEMRVRRVIQSIHQDIAEGGNAYVRQILRGPRELYRIELERPEMAYTRITILDGDALETLIEETAEATLQTRFRFQS